MAMTAQTRLLSRRVHSRVETKTDARMSSPPMVGVPAFLRCVWGPSSRISWPYFLSCSHRMNGGYSSIVSSSAVVMAAAARKLM
jgi:hypothetical protein